MRLTEEKRLAIRGRMGRERVTKAQLREDVCDLAMEEDRLRTERDRYREGLERIEAMGDVESIIARKALSGTGTGSEGAE